MIWLVISFFSGVIGGVLLLAFFIGATGGPRR